MKDSKEPIFKMVMIFTPMMFYLISLSWCLIDLPILCLFIPILYGYFWFAYAIRILKVYDNGIEIFFPLRFKPIYKKRKIFLEYKEIRKIIVSFGRSEETRIVLSHKRRFFGIEKDDFYLLWLDVKKRKRNRFLTFMREQNIPIIFKPEDMTPDG